MQSFNNAQCITCMRMFLQVAFLTECFASVICVCRSNCFLIQQCGSPAFIIFSPHYVPLSDYTGSYKGDGIVNGTPEKVWECLKPVPNGLRVKWDNNVKRFEVLEQITEVCYFLSPFCSNNVLR